jgi:hypothetical protein
MSRGSRAQVLSALIFTTVAVCSPGVAAADETSVGQSCIHHPSIKRSKVLNDRNVLFVMNDKTMYNNVLPKQCPGMNSNTPLSYTYSNNSALCNGSTVTVLQRVGASSMSTPITLPGSNQHISVPAPAFVPTFVCPLGYFIPVTQEEVDLIVATTKEQQAARRQQRRAGREAIKTESVELPQPASSSAE